MEKEEFSLFLVKNSLIDKADPRFKSLMKWQDVDLFRRPLSFLFPADAHGRLDKLLECDDALLEGVVFPRVPLRLKTGGFINFDMKMKRLGYAERRLDFFRPGKHEGSFEVADTSTDLYSFFNFVEGLLNSPYEGEIGLAMVSVDALREGSTLSDTAKYAARQEIEKGLKARAIGATLGIMDEASYGLLVDGTFDEKAYATEMLAVAASLKIDPAVLTAKTARMNMDNRTLDTAELQRALAHSRAIFLGEVDTGQPLTCLSGVLDGIQHNRKLIEQALSKYEYRVSPRVILDTVKSTSLAHLQQGKINLEGKICQPDEILVMADHPDLCLVHDLAQLDDLIRMRVRKKQIEREVPDYYELCRSTLIQEGFFEGLAKIMEKYNERPVFVGFRIKGVPPVKRGGIHWHALGRLADLGHPLWIDRFGDAVLETEALGCVRGGYVEIQPNLMRKLAGHFDGKDLMEKLVETWRYRDVGVLSCDLPDYDMKVLAQEMGIHIAVEDAT